MRHGGRSSQSKGAYRGWFNQTLDRFFAVFSGQPLAPLVTFDPNGRDIDVRRRDIVAPASLLAPGASSISPLPKAILVDVVLPKDIMLTRLLSLPKSARNKVAEIAAFDLVRKTPFKPTDVYSAVWLETSSGDELSVTQHVAKRSEIDAILRRLESVGLRVRKICIENRASSPLVDRTELVAPYAKVWRRLNIALVGLGGLLATALWTIPGWHAQNAIAKLEPALLERRTDVVAMRQRFEQKNASATQTERFLQAVTQRARMVEILRALTVTLPDEVWLSDVVLRQGQLVISGETSGSATDLVLNLAKTPIFIGPRLSGPVSRTSNGGERFQIAMTVEVQ